MDKITEEKIKQAVNIVDVIGDFIELRKRGVEYQGLCPFHDDRTLGNFSVNPNKGLYKCFACGAGGDAIEFLMKYERLSYGEALHYLAHKYSIPVDDDYDRERWKNIKPAQPRQIVEVHKEMLVIERDIVRQTMKATDNDLFITWLRHLPWDTQQEQERLEKVLWLYCIGHWSDGRVVFWQIDEQGLPRSGKLMKYLTDGHRDKSRGPGWIHNQQGVREQLDLEHYEYRATLFGMHLTRKYPTSIIHLVESEKTALICATHYGNMEKNLWLACGGLNFLKIEALKPLIEQQRTIYLWPDKDGVEAWEKARNTIIDTYPEANKANIQLNTDFIAKNWREADGQKADVADILLRIMREAPKVEVVSDWPDGQPFIQQDEMNDPELHAMREKMRLGDWRRRHPTRPIFESRTDGAKTVGEIIEEHPLLKPLFQ